MFLFVASYAFILGFLLMSFDVMQPLIISVVDLTVNILDDIEVRALLTDQEW